MKVLHVLRPSAGGMLFYATRLCERLNERGIQTSIVGRDFIPAKPSPGRDYAAAQILRREAQNFDLVHAHGYRGAWVTGLAFKRARPWVWSAHNLLEMPSLFRSLFFRVVSGARFVLPVSRAIASQLYAHGQDVNRMQILYGGIDPQAFELLPTFEEARNALGLKGQPVIGALGRLSPEKGFDLLLDAMPKVWEPLPETVLLIGGEGAERERLQAQAEKLDPYKRIKLLGFVDSAKEVFCACNVACAPSRSEGLGLAALEAMACAKPVVAFHVGGLGEVVEDGKTGFLCAPGNVEALAQKLAGSLVDPALTERLGSEGRKVALTEFDFERTVDQTVEIYERALQAD